MFSENPQWGLDLQAEKYPSPHPEYKNVFEHVKDIFLYTNEDPFGVDINGAGEIFTSGKAAMMISGTWLRVSAMLRKSCKNCKLCPHLSSFPCELLQKCIYQRGWLVLDVKWMHSPFSHQFSAFNGSI